MRDIVDQTPSDKYTEMICPSGDPPREIVEEIPNSIILDKQALLDWEIKQSATIRRCLARATLNDVQRGRFNSQLDLLNLLRECVEEGDFDVKANFIKE